jgi:hypothetical protein
VEERPADAQLLVDGSRAVVTVTTNYVYIGDGTTVEFVTTYAGGDTTITVNVLPPEPAPLVMALPEPDPLPMPVTPQEPVLDVPTPEATLRASAPAPTKKRRGLMGAIRGAWFIVFTFAGEAVQYGIDNLTGLSLPPKTGMIVGASLYAAKRAIWPNATI